jgi:hypothetical protein
MILSFQYENCESRGFNPHLEYFLLLNESGFFWILLVVGLMLGIMMRLRDVFWHLFGERVVW